jgi:hypothetical protein
MLFELHNHKGSHCAAGIDADIILKVSALDTASEECDMVLASATYDIRDYETGRPISGFVTLCRVNMNDFEGDLTTTVHEVLHALVRLLPLPPAAHRTSYLHLPLFVGIK